MIESLIEFSIRNRVLVIIAVLGVMIAGIYVMRQTPVDAIPDLSENQVIVFTDWMGRSPREIEDQITYPLSVNLQGLAGVKAVRSSSEFNFSMINIIFDDSVDFYFARTRVLERLALAATLLPEGVVPYLAPDATALGQIFWYTVEGGNVDAGTLRGIQDWYVRYQLNAIPGVAQVSTVGGFPREYQIDVTPERLRAYNVTLGEIFSALQSSNSAVGGRVVQKGNAEYLVRGVGWLKGTDDIRQTVITERQGVPIRVGDVSTVQMGPEFRRSVLEKNMREVTGGVVMMRYGENPLEVTKRIKEKIRELQKGLPPGVKIVPFYDRTRLIEGAVETVRRVLEHEMLIAALAILLILVHLRSVFVVVITLPLSILISFILMRYFGISSNIMSLSGIAISIGILVDQAVVMVENSTHELTKKFGNDKITGDTTEIAVKACRQVGRPIFFSGMIMIVSFLPVFALTGQEGKMFHPLAFTKTFALFGTAMLSITLVPALIPMMIRGRLAREDKNWIVRSVTQIYRPTLRFLMGKPKTVVFLFVLLLAFGFYLARHLGREFMPPLDEGSILDMPITLPRLSVTEAADDLKARDAMIRQFPEVELIVGKAGRADTPTDPSPLDMVESIITLRPRDHWLKRKLHEADAIRESQRVMGIMSNKGFLIGKPNETERKQFAEFVSSTTLEKFDERIRQKYAQRVKEFDDRMSQAQAWFVGQRLLDQIDGHEGWTKPFSDHDRRKFLNDFSVANGTKFTDAIMVYEVEEAVAAGLGELKKDGLLRKDLTDPFAPVPSKWNSLATGVKDYLGMAAGDFNAELAADLEKFRDDRTRQWVKETNQGEYDDNIGIFEATLFETIQSEAKIKGWWNEKSDSRQLAQAQKDNAVWFRDHTFLWPLTKTELVRELDSGARQLGWANIWTQPIINRVDMLATGVRTQLGIQVFGKSPDDIQKVSNEVANVLKEIPGAVDVVPDQTVGKGYVEINIDRERAARYGIRVGDIQDVIEIALGGKAITKSIEGRERYPIRLRYARDFREDEESIKNILIAGQGSGVDAIPQMHLRDVAEVKVVEGPVMIKSENGLLRSYVQLNVRGRDIIGFVEEAQRVVGAKMKLPEGSYLGWTGQFEHEVRAKKTLRVVFPAVIAVIFLILFLTYRDIMHALLMMLAVPGALAGGVMFQTLLGYNFSVAVWVGYIACFGMATETGIIMLVYLRAAIEDLGGLVKISNLKILEEAVMTGAVHRLRPKLLTEGTAIVGLAPMLWAHGVGAEVIAPMAAPVLGGLLIADEVIDIFLPVLFYHLEARRWKKMQKQEHLLPGT